MDSCHDYVLIGAGSAGCTLAAELARLRPDRSVLVLEAGGSDRHPFVRIPAAFSRAFQTRLDWNLYTASQPALDGRRLYWPRGKSLGGSSSINAMIYQRGHGADYDDWAARGAEGWNWDQVEPHFRATEGNQHPPDPSHGTTGALRVRDQPDPHPLSRAMIAAFAERGVLPSADLNNGNPRGAALNQVTLRGSRRWSAADAFLRPAMEQGTVQVQPRASVKRVVIERGRAVGVEWRGRWGGQHLAHARREVILCAGAVHSPTLLMLSGVGPAEHLRELGIPVLASLPGVGENLQDHLVVGAIAAVRAPGTLGEALTLRGALRYLLRGRGPLASNVAEVCAFAGEDDAGLPAWQFHGAPGYFKNHGLGRETTPAISLGPVLLRPRSVGRIRLSSAELSAPPEIDPRYGSDPRDLDSLVAGIRLARRVLAAPALAPWHPEEVLPGLACAEDDLDALRAHVRATGETLYHPVGTCRMGAAADPGAVLDPQLRVRGVAGLRVVDASVMPVIPRGNTHAPTVMLAHRAARMIADA